jgi:hypothetical protein
MWPFTLAQTIIMGALWVSPTLLMWLSNRATRLLVRDVLDAVLDSKLHIEDNEGHIS